MAIDEIADRLYGLPLDQFTSERDEAARALRNDGRREDADEVKALRKPTAAAAAVNRLVREHRSDLDTFLKANVALRDAQLSGKGDLEAATARQRETLEQLVRVGGEPVRQTLTAAAVDDEAATELLQGRLVRELEPRGFGTLLAHAPPAPRPSKAKPKTASQRQVAAQAETARRERLRQANADLAAAIADERAAVRRLASARRAIEAAQAAVDRAQLDSK